MSEINYVIDKIEVKFKGAIDLNEFYHMLKDELETLGYSLQEKEFVEQQKEALTVKWKATRLVDEYTQFILKISLKAEELTKVDVKKKRLDKGHFNVSVKAQIERDYEDRWVGPIKTFIRGVYDRYLVPEKFNKLEAELKDDAYTIIERVKAYLNTIKIR
ncbi:MAG: hypothetical protein PHD81_03375 [Candidatus Nanoarchaeia archaeon]|nr:hypothetical protein [Candidatus Nanoarchaeia archaeon]MDD5588126.1 hypothetical protein [Candidatus Nanoarchaeia archaeon]